MANYLVASGSRKISQLEIATNPVPENSSSAMLLVIGDSFPATNATTVQITPDNFLSNLVFDANETYTGNNTFSGTNIFSGQIESRESASFQSSAGQPITIVKGGEVEIYELNAGNTLRLTVDETEGALLQDYGADYETFLQVQPSAGDVHIKRNTVISGSLTVQEVFYVFETASILNSSGSTIFGNSGDDTHTFSGSILLSGSLSIIDGATLDGVDLSVFSSSVQAESQSFALRLTQDEADLSLLSSSYETFSGSQYNADSSSFSADITQNEGDILLLSSSYETFSGSQYNDDSASFSADITQNEGDILLLSSSYETFSGSQYQTDSGSFSTRVTTNETDISNLQTDSGSFSTRVTQNEGDISLLSGSFLTASGSFSTRVTQNEGDISQNTGDISLLSGSFLTASGSFSTRVTQNTGDISILSASFETTSSKLIDASGSFSTRVTNNELTGSDHEDRIVKGTNAVTSSAISSSYIDLDVLANGDVPAHKAGRIFFGQEDGALNVYNEQADITLQVGQEFLVRAYNKSGVEITDGTPVFASSSQGDRIGIYPATAPDHTSGPVFENHILGVATHTIGIAEEGYVTAQGIVRGVDTSGFTAGDILYLQTGSPATVTDFYRNDPPPFPYDVVQVGYVARAQANGFIFVEPKEPVHFSNISGLSGSYTPEVGDLWVYQENGSWTHTRNLTGSYTIGGDLLPETTEIHDLGSPSLRWRDLYLSGSTIDLGGLLIQRTADGNVQFIDSASQATKTIDIDSITGSLSITGDLSVTSLTASRLQLEDGTNNILIGGQSGYVLDLASAGYNIFVGESAGFSLKEGSGNIGIGFESLYKITDTTSDGNIAIGFQAAKSMDSGSYNVSIGNASMVSADNTNDAIGIGRDSLRNGGDYQIGIGYRAGYNLTGGNNIVIGANSGQALNSSAASNTGIGYNSLGAEFSNVGSGVRNTAVGNSAFYSLQNNTDSTAVGAASGYNSLGNQNTFIGSYSGFYVSNGNDNLTVGYQSGYQSAGLGTGLTTGNGNTLLGTGTKVQNSTNNNSIVIGSGSIGNGSNTVVIGNDSITNTELKGDVTISGSLIMATSGSGIDFSATPTGSGGLGSSQLLNHYEEGTWTMGITFGGNNVDVTYSDNTGRYTKIGNMVTATGYLILTSKGTSNGDAVITGLPYTIPNDNSYVSPASLYIGNVGFANHPMAVGLINTTTIALQEVTEAGTVTNLTDAEFGNNAAISITLTYFV